MMHKIQNKTVFNKHGVHDTNHISYYIKHQLYAKCFPLNKLAIQISPDLDSNLVELWIER